jgi:hypothetical protein
MAWLKGNVPKCLLFRMTGKTWLSAQQNARDGMILPALKPSDLHGL